MPIPHQLEFEIDRVIEGLLILRKHGASSLTASKENLAVRGARLTIPQEEIVTLRECGFHFDDAAWSIDV